MEGKLVRTILTLPGDLHKTIRTVAALQGKTMNELIIDAVRKHILANSSEIDSFVEGWRQGKKGLGLWEQPIQEEGSAEIISTAKK